MRLKKRLTRLVIPKKVQWRRLALRRERSQNDRLRKQRIYIAGLKGRYDELLSWATSTGDPVARQKALQYQAAIILGLRKLARNGHREALPEFMARHGIPPQWLKSDSSSSSRSA